MTFLARVCARASTLQARIAFAEASDPRVLEAAVRLAQQGVARPVLVLDPSATHGQDHARSSGLACVNPAVDPRLGELTDTLCAVRAKHGLDRDDAHRLARDPLVFANWLLRNGEVDAVVAGAVRTTSDVIRYALWLVGPAPTVRTVSSAFYMCVPAFRGASAGEGEVLTYTDCAVVPTPTAAQLADIAIAAAEARRRIVGDEPRVALLSFSTLGSGGESGSIAIVRDALAMIREREPALRVDGELQADAALIAGVAMRKAPGGMIAGDANVLVFPSLDAGNIAYKLTERLAGATAIGPILQGLARPVADLSRGADADAIFHAAAIAALQSQPAS